jgi:hypothetical protein
MRRTLNYILRTGGAASPMYRRLRPHAVRIWSGEHTAYWRSEGRGYTLDPVEAGCYSFREAFERTKHCGPEKRIAFELVET